MYIFPAHLPRMLQSSYTTDESARFQISQPGAGSYFSQIISDDAPTYFNVRWAFLINDAQVFRAWLRQDNFAVLNGAEFEIGLPTEDGIVKQVASFLPDGIPQRSGETNKLLYYNARLMVRRLKHITDGCESLVLCMPDCKSRVALDLALNTLEI